MTTITLKRTRPKLKQDLEPARWWAVIVNENKDDMTRRIEIDWNQSLIEFRGVIREGTTNLLLVLDGENGNVWFEAFLRPTVFLPADNDTRTTTIGVQMNWSQL